MRRKKNGVSASSMRRKYGRFLFGLLVFVLSFPCQVEAAGFYLPARGVHSLSRGGACVAGGDTLQAIWYNPANLVEMMGFNALVDIGLISTQVHYQRASRMGENGQKINYAPVDNEAMPLPDPTLLLAYGWKKYHVTFAGGIYAPYAANLKFPELGAQRYAIIDMTESLFINMHLALAWSPDPRFRLGFGLQNVYTALRLISAGSAYLGVFGAPEDPELDLFSEARLNAPINISGNLGLWGRLIQLPQLTLDLAASLQFPVLIKSTGTLKVRLPTHPLFDSASIQGDKIFSELTLPLIVRAAFRARFPSLLDVEVTFVYEGWSALKEITLTPDPQRGIVVKNVPTIGDYRIPNITIPRDMKDAFSLRLGSSIHLRPWLDLQLGYAYETTSIPDETHSLFLIDANKHLLALGLSFIWKKQRFEIVYAHFFQETRDVKKENCSNNTTSNDKKSSQPRCLRQINPLNPEGAIVIGRGRYESSYNIVGISWQGQF